MHSHLVDRLLAVVPAELFKMTKPENDERVPPFSLSHRTTASSSPFHFCLQVRSSTKRTTTLLQNFPFMCAFSFFHTQQVDSTS